MKRDVFLTPALQVLPLATSQDTLGDDGRLVVSFFCVRVLRECLFFFCLFVGFVGLTLTFVGHPLNCALLCECPTGELLQQRRVNIQCTFSS